MNNDADHLKLLSIFHYIVAGLTALFACVPCIHLAMGVAMVSGAFNQPGESGPPAWFGWVIIVMASLFILGGWTLAALLFAAGRCLARHKRRVFCVVVAALACVLMPYGTVLGVFTIVVLMRPSVARLFDLPSAIVAESS